MSSQKGADLLLDAVERLDAAGTCYRLTIFGYVDRRLRQGFEASASVTLAPGYAPAELDRLLDDIDVGIVPSVWEEAYGYVGIELLARASR